MTPKVAELKSFPVFGPQGQLGDVLATSRFLDERPEKTIRLLDGREIQVPSSALQIQDDGVFYLSPDVSVNGSAASASDKVSAKPDLSPPPPQPPPAQAGPSFNREDALFESGYNVETVRVDRIVEGPVERRQEGDVLILPVVEEVWVTEKKLLLKEEIRITPRKREVDQIRTFNKQ